MARARSAAIRIAGCVERRAGDRVVKTSELSDGEIVGNGVARYITSRERRIDVGDREVGVAVETEVECVDQKIDVVLQADVDMDAAARDIADFDRSVINQAAAGFRAAVDR